MDFSKGDRMALSATVSSVGSPISIFLIKGTISYNDWVRSEEVDLDDIKTGNASSGTNTTFLVVSNFSLMNTTGFEGRIEIGDRDVYYLVIALHRYAGMPAKDILLMTSTVDYDVSWEFEEKDIPLWLVPIAVLFFVVGVALVVYSLWKRTPRAPEGPKTREASRAQTKGQGRPPRKARWGPSDPR
jgi:hypothetical protein